MKKDRSKALILACRNGDPQAFGALVKEYEKPVFNVVFRMLHDYEEARDVTQTVFMKAYEHLGSFDESRKFFSWIYRIAINESTNAVAVLRPGQGLASHVVGNDDPERDARCAQLRHNLENALMMLSTNHRSVVILKHLLGFSYQEIGEILELPEKTVKSRLYDARERLRGLLDRDALQ